MRIAAAAGAEVQVQAADAVVPVVVPALVLVEHQVMKDLPGHQWVASVQAGQLQEPGVLVMRPRPTQALVVLASRSKHRRRSRSRLARV